MFAPKLSERFTGRSNSPLLYIFKTLPDTFRRVDPCSEVELLLASFGIIVKVFHLAVDCTDRPLFPFLRMLITELVRGL